MGNCAIIKFPMWIAKVCSWANQILKSYKIQELTLASSLPESGGEPGGWPGEGGFPNPPPPPVEGGRMSGDGGGP